MWSFVIHYGSPTHSVAADFVVSRVVDRTVGVHGVISKAHVR